MVLVLSYVITRLAGRIYKIRPTLSHRDSQHKRDVTIVRGVKRGTVRRRGRAHEASRARTSLGFQSVRRRVINHGLILVRKQFHAVVVCIYALRARVWVALIAVSVCRFIQPIAFKPSVWRKLSSQTVQLFANSTNEPHEKDWNTITGRITSCLLACIQ